MVAAFGWQFEYGDKLEFFQDLSSKGRETPLDTMPNFGDIEIEWFLETYIKISKLAGGVPDADVILGYASRIDLLVGFESFIDIICSIREAHTEFLNRDSVSCDG